jgi:iron complex transport system permease protein
VRQNKVKYLFLAAVLFFVIAAAMGICLGSTRLELSELFSGTSAKILVYVRIPRTLSCLVSGAALALSGCIIQGVLGNHLASPGILGVNAGAGLSITVCAAIGLYGGLFTSVFSFAGAFLSVLVITLGARKWGSSKGTVILAGVALNSLLNAISSAIITLVPDAGVMSNDFRVGDFSSVTYDRLIPAAVTVLIASVAVMLLSGELDVIGLGEETARGLGMNTAHTRMIFLLLAAALAGCAVSLAGLLSFVGLIIPNIIRRIAGNSGKRLLPLSALFGGGFACLCDTAARTLFSPYEIPVGIIMSFIGAPFFIFLLVKGGTRHDRA